MAAKKKTRRAPARKATTRAKAKKTTTRRKATKRKATRAKAAPAKTLKLTTAHKARTKTEIMNLLAEHAEISRKQVAAVFEGMSQIIAKDLTKRGPGQFNVPGLLKIRAHTKPARKAGIRPNPFKPGEMMKVKAKPATRVVKVRALKGLKELV